MSDARRSLFSDHQIELQTPPSGDSNALGKEMIEDFANIQILRKEELVEQLRSILCYNLN